MLKIEKNTEKIKKKNAIKKLKKYLKDNKYILEPTLENILSGYIDSYNLLKNWRTIGWLEFYVWKDHICEIFINYKYEEEFEKLKEILSNFELIKKFNVYLKLYVD